MTANEHLLGSVLEPDEAVIARVRAANNAILAVTDRRLAVVEETRVAVVVPIESVRRIQFDIEKSRPATLVIVPESPSDQPQVLAIPREEYEPASRAIVQIARRLDGDA